MIKIHSAGKNTVIYSLVLWLISLAFFIYCPSILGLILFLLFLLALIFCLNFFRNPPRPITLSELDPNTVLCPADGEVVVIEKTFETEILNQEMWQISIFMSPLNVHVNRSPISGVIEYFKYHKGKFLVAWHPKSSTENERTTLVIRNKDHTAILVRQIAGAVARRIIAYVEPGQSIVQGEDFGFIRFGSRVDVFLPLDATILVKKGQKVFGNRDQLALLPQKQ